LAYCNAAHPAALLFTGPSRESAALKQLDSTDPMVGMLPPGVPFETRKVAVGAYARLLVYSDGVFEIERPDGSMWQYAEFVDYLTPLAGQDDLMERLYGQVRQLRGADTLADDFSLLDVRWR
jgi:sigma-B regulation protein RsbU (phosphoserine phosphatase)